MKNLLRYPSLILIIITAAIICICWSKIVFHPNKYLLCTGGDAFKNYYTPAWYVKYDHGVHFSGMNYPYGDHVVFTDDQPVISGIINLIDDHIFSISDYTVGILNVLMFLSLLFCVVLVFKILVHYGLAVLYSMIAALLIGLMNPQLERFWGHFALTYSIFLPLIWYMMIRLKKSNYSFWKLILTICVISFFGLIHMYYILIAGMFCFFYLLAVFFREKRTRKQILSLLAVSAIPLLLITLFMKISDHVNDRPQNPYGFFRYKASFQTVFLSKGGTIHNQIVKLMHLSNGDSEGYAFVGTTGLIFLFILLFIFLKRWFYKKSFSSSFINLPGDMGSWFIAGVCMLMFSMTLPFSLGLQFLLDVITPLKQFRSPGRFAWGFYYTYTIMLGVLIWLLFKKIKKTNPAPAYLFIFAFGALQCSDTLNYFTTTAKGIQKNNAENPFVTSSTYFNSIFEGTKYTAGDFDAILFLPSFFSGSEKLYVDRTEGMVSKAMELSWHTGLPLVDQMMSRTSFSQTMNNVQLVSHPYINNKSKDGVFIANKLLVMTVDKQMWPGEKYIVDHAEKFASRDGYNFYAFDMQEARKKGDALAIADLNRIRNSISEYHNSNSVYYSEQPLQLFYHNGFDDHASRDPFNDSGSFISDNEEKRMAEIPVNIQQSIWIEVSFWAKSDIYSVAYPYIKVDFLDEKKNYIKLLTITPTLSTDVSGDWVRASENYEVDPAVKWIRITCSDNSPVNFDELVVRHTAYSAYYDMVDSTHFKVNNYLIGK